MQAILAINNLNYIGLNKRLPWKCKEDLKMFKNLTYGKIMLCGYRTYETLPKAVKKRKIIIDTRDGIIIPDYEGEFTLPKDTSDIICIGGAKTYKKYSHLFTDLHISHINDETVGDVEFIKLDLQLNCKIHDYYFNVD